MRSRCDDPALKQIWYVSHIHARILIVCHSKERRVESFSDNDEGNWWPDDAAYVSLTHRIWCFGVVHFTFIPPQQVPIHSAIGYIYGVYGQRDYHHHISKETEYCVQEEEKSVYLYDVWYFLYLIKCLAYQFSTIRS